MAPTSMKTVQANTDRGFRQGSPSFGNETSTDPAPRAPKSQSPRPKEFYIALLATAGILIHLIFRFVVRSAPAVQDISLYATLAAGGVPLIIDLSRKLLARQFGSDLLAGISIVTAVLLSEYLVGAIVVLMLSGGTALEQYATRRASSVLQALARRMPHTAHRRHATEVSEVSLDEITIGDTLEVFPHEICPVDGTVVEGHGVMDEAYLTGEPFQIPKAPGSQVISGALNGDSAVTIIADKLPVDSRYARIMRVVQESEQNRPQLRRLGDKLGSWYTPVALLLAASSSLWSGDPHRFLAVMVVATPCPLLIAIPVAVIGAISLAARRAIIVRNPAALEQVDTCQTLIFDKTGTLTYGRPSLTEIYCAPGYVNDEVLRKAASLEVYSKHPLASGIVAAAQKAGLPFEPVSRISEKPGQGLQGVIAGHQVLITGRRQAERLGLAPPTATAGLECLLILDGTYAATLQFRDTPRAESHSFLRHLRPQHQISRILLVSGDRESEVRYLAESVGIGEVHFEKSPEEKVTIVTEETRRARTLYVGDGINDAPAFLAATIGVAFGQNSDITLEAADVVILEASLRKVDELIHIGRRMRSIALQSALGGMLLSIAGMVAAASGHLPALGGAIAQEVIDLGAVLNALRIALPPANLTDF